MPICEIVFMHDQSTTHLILMCLLKQLVHIAYYLPPGFSPGREIIKWGLCVRACVRACVSACVGACVRECVRALVCHADFSKTMTVTHFL